MSLSNLLHWVCTSMLLQMTMFHSFLWLKSHTYVPYLYLPMYHIYICTISLSIHQWTFVSLSWNNSSFWFQECPELDYELPLIVSHFSRDCSEFQNLETNHQLVLNSSRHWLSTHWVSRSNDAGYHHLFLIKYFKAGF